MHDCDYLAENAAVSKFEKNKLTVLFLYSRTKGAQSSFVQKRAICHVIYITGHSI